MITIKYPKYGFSLKFDNFYIVSFIISLSLNIQSIMELFWDLKMLLIKLATLCWNILHEGFDTQRRSNFLNTWSEVSTFSISGDICAGFKKDWDEFIDEFMLDVMLLVLVFGEDITNNVVDWPD